MYSKCPPTNSYFNSIKVRLKPYKGREETSLWLFQFHKGTIKTGVSNNATTSNNVFQFHKGTIKTKQGHKAKK